MATTVHEVGTFMPAPHTLESVGSFQYFTRTPWEEETKFAYDLQNNATLSISSTSTWLPGRMGNQVDHSFKRRRTYGPGYLSTEPLYQGPTSSPVIHNTQASPVIHNTHASPISPPNNQFILEQAARILQVPVPQLLQLGQPREPCQPPSFVKQAALTLDVPVSSLFELQEKHRHKRPRIETESPTSYTYSARDTGQAGGEKAVQDGRQAADSNHGRYSWATIPSQPEQPTYLGLSGPRIANAFENFSPYNPNVSYDNSQEEHHRPAATASPYYDEARVIAIDTPTTPVNLPNTRVADYDSATPITQANQPGMVGSDAPGMVNGYMAQFSALPRPRHAATALEQHAGNRDMIYYQGSATNQIYSSPVPSDQHLAIVPVHSASHVMDNVAGYRNHQERPDTPSPISSHAGGIDDLAPGYEMYAAYNHPTQMMDNSGAAMEFCNRPRGFDLIYSTQRAPPAKRGPFKDHGEREQTAQTRRIGSCVRCRMQRIRCHIDPSDPTGCCLTCKKVANTNKIWRLPCLRLKINNIVLSKIGQVRGFEWTSRWKDSTVADEISSWASPETKTIHVTEGFTGTSVALRVRQFIPQAGDSLERSWVGNDGVRRSVHIPNFAVVDMDATKASFDKYIKNGIWETCKRMIGPENTLMWNTYALAMKLANSPAMDKKEQQLLKSTLELWMSIRLTTTSFEIVGEETLGMAQNIMDDTSPLYGKIPLPPVLGAQLDSILIHQIQAKFRHDTLELLQKMTQENKAKTWLTTYLVTFILLHNVALVIRHDAGYARKHGMARRFAREDKVKEYYLGATTLLAYSHYRGGSKMFATDVRDDDLRIHSGEEGAQLVAFTRRYAKEHDRSWKKLIHDSNVEDEYFFISQMFEQNWMPREWPF